MSLSDLRSSTKAVRQWLANIRAEQVNFRYEMTRELKTLSEQDQQKVEVYSLIALAEQTMDTIDDIYNSLKTLSLTPPGLATGVIDFVYMLLSGRVTDTEKSKYRAKLNDLKSSMLRQRLRVVDKNMGFKEGTIEASCDGLASRHGLGKASRAALAELGQIIFDAEEGATAEQVNEKVKYLSDAITADKSSAKLTDLVRDLKAKLVELTQNSSQSNKSRVTKLLDNIKMASFSSNYTFKFSEADYTKFINDLKEWQSLFNQRAREAKMHLAKIEAQVSDVSKEESTIASRYLNLYRTLLGEHNPSSMSSILKHMADRINPIVGTLSAIDTKDNDRESLPKNPELAQNADQAPSKKEEEKPQSTQKD